MKNLKPITRQETLLAKAAGQDVPDLEPITREEFFLAKAAGQDVPTLEPVTREEYFLADVIEAIESGGGGSDLGTKTISANGTYKATDDDLDGYSKVTVDVPASAVDSGTKNISSNGSHDVTGYASASVSVPNSYAAGDEGKVVSNGALVSQTNDTVTENGTYDTTLIDSLTVNVSGGGSDLTPFITGTITSFETNESNVREGLFYECTSLVSVSLPNITVLKANMFYNCTSLQSINLPNVTSFSGSHFFSSVRAPSVIFPELISSPGGNSFNGSQIPILVFPKLQKTGTNAINSSGGLTTIDMGTAYYEMGDYSFASSGNLGLLILRKADACVTLKNVRAFNGTKFASGKAGGTIYIPKALYDHLGDGTALDYQSATNWSTVYGYGTITWAKIEGSIYENAYADGTVIA